MYAFRLSKMDIVTLLCTVGTVYLCFSVSSHEELYRVHASPEIQFCKKGTTRPDEQSQWLRRHITVNLY